MSNKDLSTKIRSAGYWETVIRPVTHDAARVRPISKLFPIIQKSAVQIRGWDFPHVDTHNSPQILQDSIAQASSWEHNHEVWRFYQSGQFVSLRGMAYDWRDESGWWPPKKGEGWERGAMLGMLDAFFTLVEIFEFAARLSNTEAGDSQMKIMITVGGLQGRTLYMDNPMRFSAFANHPAALPSFEVPPVTILRDQLLADPVAPAVEAAVELFARFNKEIAPTLIRDWLRDLRR